MDNSNKKSLKISKRESKNLESPEKSHKKDKKNEINENLDIETHEILTPKVKKSKKNKLLETENMEIDNNNQIIVIDEEVNKKKIKKSKKKSLVVSEEIEVKEIVEVEDIVTEKVKKSKKRKASEIDSVEVDEEIHADTTKKSKMSESTDHIEIGNETIKIVTPMFNALIVNLPSEVSKEEMINFLSNRGIPIDDLQLNANKYAIIETDNSDTMTQLSSLMSTKPMPNNIEMKVSQLFGNAVKLSNFSAKKPVANKRVVIVTNVNSKTHIDKILKTVPYNEEIVKHSTVNVRNNGKETQMVTIEFKTAEHTDEIITTLNVTSIDNHQLIAEYKYNLIDVISEEGDKKSNALIIKNLPLSATKESLIELTKKFDVSPNNIELMPKNGKNSCYIQFKSVKKAAAALEMLKEEVIDGMKLEVKFVAEPKETDVELAKTKLRITNLPFTVKREEMEKEFDMADSVKMPMTEHGKSKGLCYLSFKSKEMAALAMDCCQERIIGGRKIKCEYVPMSVAFDEAAEERPKKVIKTKTKEKLSGAALTLFNLPAGVTQRDITAHFANVTLFNIVKKGDSFKGIAEVHFKDAAAAAAAMAVPEFSLKGRVVRKELKGGNWRNGAPSKKTQKPTRGKKTTEKEEESTDDEDNESEES